MSGQTSPPRSPREMLLGIPWLPRAIDKARMVLAGSLGDYEFPCPADMFVLELLHLTPEEFLRHLAESGEAALEAYTAERVASFTPRERLSLDVFSIKNSRLFDSLDREEGREPLIDVAPSTLLSKAGSGDSL